MDEKQAWRRGQYQVQEGAAATFLKPPPEKWKLRWSCGTGGFSSPLIWLLSPPFHSALEMAVWQPWHPFQHPFIRRYLLHPQPSTFRTSEQPSCLPAVSGALCNHRRVIPIYSWSKNSPFFFPTKPSPKDRGFLMCSVLYWVVRNAETHIRYSVFCWGYLRFCQQREFRRDE